MISPFALRHLCLSSAFLFVAVAGTDAAELSWGQKMFDTTSHDFGVVATGAEVKHRFKITNIYKQDVHIQNVRTNCGCSAAEIPKRTLKTYESTYLEVTMDTRKFKRKKESSVIITISAPQYIEVRIPVKVYIRTDVVIEPGGVHFGVVDQGKSAQRKIEIRYAGRNNWKIESVKTNSKYLTTKLTEKSRTSGAVSYVTYTLDVSLKPDAPAGTLNQRLTLTTNDSSNPYVPILISGRVEADIVVTPGLVSFGRLALGQSKTLNVVVRGKKPFAIEKIECESDKPCFKVSLSKETKRVHVLPLTFNPPKTPGKFKELFTMTIAGRTDPVTFRATADIAPAKIAPAK